MAKNTTLIIISCLLILAGIVTNYISQFISIDYLLYLSFVLMIVPVIILIRKVLRLDKSIQLLTNISKEIIKGDFNISLPKFKDKSASALSKSMVQIQNNLQKATNFAVQIGEGNLERTVDAEEISDDILISSLDNMRERLKSLNEEEEKRNWNVQGQAKFGDILRDNINDLNNLCREVIINMVKYLGGNQGGIYVVNEDPETQEKFIDLMAFYAFEREKFLKKRIEWGDGLVGQTVLEADTIYKDEVPEDFVNITSGLGEATPRSILLVPLRLNDQVYGVIEIASFHTMEKYQIEFVESVGESIASTISSAKLGEDTKRLLEESKKNNEILVGKENEMREIQNELSHKLTEIEEEKQRSQSLVEAVNKTNASIEFDVDGTILAANDMFIGVMGYGLDELVGQHESVLIPKEERESQGYSMMWESLKNGSFFSGEFKRINKQGDNIWLNGTYNPVLDANGNVSKVIKFALFTTDEKERELKVRGQINAIKTTVPIIELKADLSIKSINDIYKKFGMYKRLELRKLKFFDFLDFSYTEGPSKEELTTMMQSGEKVATTLKYLNKEGEYRYFRTNISPIFNLEEQIDSYMLILNDVTEQIELEVKLKRQLEEERSKTAFGNEYNPENEKLSHQFENVLGELSSGEVDIMSLLDSNQLPILIVNGEKNIIKGSDSVATIFGLNIDKLVGQQIDQCFDLSSAELKDKIYDVIHKGGVYQDHLSVIAPDGTTKPYVVLIAPIYIESDLYSAITILEV